MAAPQLVTACYTELVAFVEASAPALPKSDRRFLKMYEAEVRAGAAAANQTAGQRAAIRGVFVAMPEPLCRACPATLLQAHDDILKAELQHCGVVDARTLPPLAPKVAVWQGDMARLQCDAVVNPANNAMLGCFLPSHRCLDNILHAGAGARLRVACADKLKELGLHEDANGQCRATAAFNLPAKHVFHTVGPCLLEGRYPQQSKRRPTDVDRAELASSYTQCLNEARALNLSSIAFCCISTGIFGYPSDEAAVVACKTVQAWLENNSDSSVERVVFNVFKDEDLAIYNRVVPTVFH